VTITELNIFFEQAFEKFKEKLFYSLGLKSYEFEKPSKVYIDANNCTIRKVFIQNGRLVAFEMKKPNDA